jgi:CRP-like cAMP-binding protein
MPGPSASSAERGAQASLGESLFRKLERRDVISAEERRLVAELLVDPTTVDAGAELLREGDRPISSTLIVEGFAARFKVTETGARQITALHGPGDFVDIHSFLLKVMDHGIVTLTRCRIARAPHAGLKRISETHPHLSRMLTLLALIDGSIHREWLVAMGRRTAQEHAAHLICETYVQLEMVGMAPDHAFLFPITQAVLGDMLGLSTVHVNRVIQSLRAADLIAWDGVTMRILDWERLKELGQFDFTYLNVTREPR